MSTQTPFYNSATERKLAAVERYLESFLSVLSRQAWVETVYIDAFAGSGTIPTTTHLQPTSGLIEADELAVGSALRAVGLQRKFSRYIFIEKSEGKLEELKQKIGELRDPPSRVEYICGGANEEIHKICSLLSHPKVRSVVFFDPFGNQVGWKTLEALAATQHVDLWYLFPAMLGVYRQIGNQNAKMTDEQRESLNRLFGPHDWQSAFIARGTQRDLFGESEVAEKIADVNDVTRFQIQCLKTVFRGHVEDKWLPLGRNSRHWYSLLFAMANPSPKAVQASRAIATHIMTHS